MFHELRDKLLKIGYTDNIQRSLEKKKEWRKITIKKINKSKSVAEKTFNHNVKCPPGSILKRGFIRESYTRKNGTKVAKKVVKPTCIKKGVPLKNMSHLRAKQAFRL